MAETISVESKLPLAERITLSDGTAIVVNGLGVTDGVDAALFREWAKANPAFDGLIVEVTPEAQLDASAVAVAAVADALGQKR